MDSKGQIHQLTVEQLEQVNKMYPEGELTLIPEKMIGRVTFLPGKQRRAWRELVRAGADPEVALLQVQSTL
jgi:hypothetical protein